MASSEKKPRKGILKTSTSFDQNEPTPRSKEMSWDEMNIIATHHPPDKDYGHMKIDEPPTPYSKSSEPEDDDDENARDRRGSVSDSSKLDASSLSNRLEGIEGPRLRRVSTEDENSSEEDEELSEDQQVHKKQFEQKRKLHYNEFQAIRLAKQLMEEGDEDEEDDNDDNNTQDSVHMQTDQSHSTDITNTGSDIPVHNTDENNLAPLMNISGPSALGQRNLVETTVDAAGHLETQIN